LNSPQKSEIPELRVVAIGGGTGLSTLLRGLKRFVPAPIGSRRATDRVGASAPRNNIPATPHAHVIRDLAGIVTVTDDGGSSGRLRENFNMLPPGDVRNCMVAVSEDEHLLARLFQYRFRQGDLEGHSFGNLFLAAMADITGDFAQAVQTSSQILAARGRIYPATNTNVTLAAQMDNGTIVRGETSITASQHRIIELMLEPSEALPLPEALDAIAHAALARMRGVPRASIEKQWLTPNGVAWAKFEAMAAVFTTLDALRAKTAAQAAGGRGVATVADEVWRDLVRRAGEDRSIRSTKIGVVQGVEELRAELEVDLFRKSGVLEER